MDCPALRFVVFCPEGGQKMTKTILLTTAVLLIAACDRGTPPVEQNVARPAEAQNAAGASASNTVAAAAEPQPAASYTLAGDGLAPDLKFGMKDSDVIAAATNAFGTPGKREHNDECGEGAMDFVSFHDLQLAFQDGKWAGWSLSGKTPALHTAGGIGIGTPRKALGKVEIDEQSSLGPEFAIGDVGGVLGEDGKVMALWAGSTCQFR
jgi:hypothetical protein